MYYFARVVILASSDDEPDAYAGGAVHRDTRQDIAARSSHQHLPLQAAGVPISSFYAGSPACCTRILGIANYEQFQMRSIDYLP